MYIHQNRCIKASLRHCSPVASFNKKKGCAAPFVEQLLSWSTYLHNKTHKFKTRGYDNKVN